jgi:hypothetical protein
MTSSLGDNDNAAVISSSPVDENVNSKNKNSLQPKANGDSEQFPQSPGIDASPVRSDVERMPSVPCAILRDPFLLRGGLTSDAQLATLRQRKNGKRLAAYYHKQNDVRSISIQPPAFATDVRSLLADQFITQADGSSHGRGKSTGQRCAITREYPQSRASCPRLIKLSQIKIAVWVSLIANLSLCAIQCLSMSGPFHSPPPILTLVHVVYAAGSSASLSLIATAIDSVFDLGSNMLLFWLHRKATRLDVNKWPVGGARLTTIGNVVYGIIIIPPLVDQAEPNRLQVFCNLSELSLPWTLLTNHPQHGIR